jgi:hypothetical protein
MTILNIGDLVVDCYGNEGIVLSTERRPSAAWLGEQSDERMRKAVGPWWNVLPLDGGAVIVPDDLGRFVRRATIDDFLQLIDAQQNEHAGQVTAIELLRNLRRKKIARGPKKRD